MSSGYIGIYRSLFSHWIWCEDRPRTKAEAFIDLLQLAAWAPTKRLSNDKLIALNPGELVASERYLSERWKWSRTKVRAYLEILAKDQMLTRKPDQGETIIKLCNYAAYNANKDAEEPEKDTSNNTAVNTKGEPGRDQNKEVKEVEEALPRAHISKYPRLTYPASLDSQTFRKHFERWQDHLYGLRNRKPTLQTLDAHLLICSKLGLSRSVEAIDNAINRGLYEPAEARQPMQTGKNTKAVIESPEWTKDVPAMLDQLAKHDPSYPPGFFDEHKAKPWEYLPASIKMEIQEMMKARQSA